jgi:ABC-type transport system involved in multi-copper enzyme maturation, permease component
MTWEAVATKEFRDAIRSRWLQGATLVLTILLAGTTGVFFGVILGSEAREISNLFGIFINLGVFNFSFTGLIGLILGFIALSTTYGSITDERASGSIKLLLSLPNDRQDVVIGKFLGRTAVVVASVLIAFIITFMILIATGTSLQLGMFLPHIALTVLLGIVFAAIGLGISAGADSNREATLSAMALYLIFALLWGAVASGIPRILLAATNQVNGLSLSETTQATIALALSYLNPLRLYETLAAQLYSSPATARLVTASLQQRALLAPQFESSVPPYFSGWALLVVFILWVILPIIVGYSIFERRDL